MAKVCVFLDHDIIIRNFIKNKVIQQLEASHHLTYVFPYKYPKRISTDIDSLGLKNVRYVTIDNNRAYLWRMLYHHIVIKFARSKKKQSKKFIYDLWKQFLGKKLFYKAWLTSLPGFFYFYKNSMLKKIGEFDELNSLLNELKPDIILHPSVLEGLFVSDLVRLGKRLNIPTVFIMNSWDNPIIKAMVVDKPDWLVVWGEHTRQIAHRYMGIDLKNILSFGAAQFQVYREKPIITNEDFRGQLGVTSNTTLILYAGSSAGLNEVGHLKVIEHAITNCDLPNCKVLYRPHPWRGINDNEESFFSYKWKHVIIDPQMEEYYKISLVDPKLMYMSDINYTHVVLSSVDVVISPLSTILIEAAIHDKPVLAYVSQDEIRESKKAAIAVITHCFEDFFIRLNCGPYSNTNHLLEALKKLLVEFPSIQPGDIKNKSSYFSAQNEKIYTEQLNELIEKVSKK